MIQVKLIKKPTERIEGEINDWLKRLPSAYPNANCSIIDIKMTDVDNITTVLIIYHIGVKPPTNP